MTALGVLGCSGGREGSAVDIGGDSGGDGAEAVVGARDFIKDEAERVVTEVVFEIEPDLWRLPWDGKLRVGMAVKETPAPIGIPTAGYSQTYDKEVPHSQFTSTFAATTKQHTPLLVKGAYFQRLDKELILLRIDKVGTTPDLLDETTRRLEKATGRKWDGKVIAASNHTHLGPGRLWENVVGHFANDDFWPYYYDLYVDSLVECALAAIEDAEVAKVGYATTQCPECHLDRRCENPPNLDSTLWVIKIEREDGSLKGVILDFPIHGTVLSWSDMVLSGDAPGMIEQKVQETFDAPAEVLMLQSWAGDVGPGDPQIEPLLPLNTTIPERYSRLERIGLAAANHVWEVLDSIETQGDLEVNSITLRLPMYHELMGYEEGDFPYEGGALLCGLDQPTHCWGEEGPDPYMLECIPLPEEKAVRQVTLSAFTIGELLFVTLPGEPHTDLGQEAAAMAAEVSGLDNVVVVGYAQDHWGYLMKEYDWWLGGYEPTVTVWGPRQGRFIIDYVPHVVLRMLNPDYELPLKPLGYLPPISLSGKPYVPMDSSTQAQALEQPAAVVGETEAAVFRWAGGDPWFGTPLVSLEAENSGSWRPVLQHDGRVLDNRSYLMETALEILPSWNDDKKSTTRQFIWTVTMPIRRNVPTPTVLKPGKYRFRVSGTIKVGGHSSPFELLSAMFLVSSEQ